MIRWIPQTLFWRLVLVWLCSLLLLKAITLLTVNAWSDQILFRHMANTEARLLSLYAHVLTRQLPIKTISDDRYLEFDPELRVRVTSDQPTLEADSSELSEILQTRVILFFEKGHVPYRKVFTNVQVLTDNERVHYRTLWGSPYPAR